MNINLPNYRYTNIVAFAAAIALHTGLAAWAMQPQDPVVFPQQVMQINFVAPSSTPQDAQIKSEVFVKEPIHKKHKKGLHKKKESKKKNKRKAKKHSKAAKSSQTSGKTAKHATAKHSAQTEPMFDAAYLNNPAPVYPYNARRRGVQGKVILDVFVQKDGSAGKVNLEHSSGFRSLDNAALEAVKQWRFIPAKHGTKYVEARVIVPVEFKLN